MKCSVCGSDHLKVDRFFQQGMCPECIKYAEANSEVRLLAKVSNLLLAIKEGIPIETIRIIEDTSTPKSNDVLYGPTGQPRDFGSSKGSTQEKVSENEQKLKKLASQVSPSHSGNLGHSASTPYFNLVIHRGIPGHQDTIVKTARLRSPEDRSNPREGDAVYYESTGMLHYFDGGKWAQLDVGADAKKERKR